jgi:hypothetical protein
MITTLKELKSAVDEACNKYKNNLDLEVEIKEFWPQGGKLKLVASEEWPYNLEFSDEE